MRKRKPVADQSRRAPSLTEVAQLAGVSASAVSRTFTAGASVSESTRKKVIDAARRLQFRPGHGVQTPDLRRSHIVAVAVAELDDQFYSRAVGLLSDALGDIGYRPLVFVTHDRWHPVYQQLLNFRVDALLLLSAQGELSLASECRQFGIPVVLCVDAKMTGQFASVSATNFLGGQQIASFLVAGGHRRMAFIGGVDCSMEQEREAGFNSVIAAAGLPRAQRVRSAYQFDRVAASTRKLFSGSVRPDAIFCVNDQTALACMQIVRSEFALVPGKDISIVGFDDIELARWPAFELTSYSQSIHRMVDRTVQILRRLLAGEQLDAVHEVVPGRLMVRGSARLPATGIRTAPNGDRTWSTEDAVTPPIADEVITETPTVNRRRQTYPGAARPDKTVR